MEQAPRDEELEQPQRTHRTQKFFVTFASFAVKRIDCGCEPKVGALAFRHVDQDAVGIGHLVLTEAAGREQFLPHFVLRVFLRSVVGVKG